MLEEVESCSLSLDGSGSGRIEVCLKASAKPIAVRLKLFLHEGDKPATPISLDPERRPMPTGPIASSPQLQPAIEAAMIEWDWRMHDGIGTPREAVSYQASVEVLLQRGDLLANDLLEQELLEEKDIAAWRMIRAKFEALKAEKSTDEAAMGDALASNASSET